VAETWQIDEIKIAERRKGKSHSVIMTEMRGVTVQQEYRTTQGARRSAGKRLMSHGEPHIFALDFDGHRFQNDHD
jgi:hypothetical protein